MPAILAAIALPATYIPNRWTRSPYGATSKSSRSFGHRRVPGRDAQRRGYFFIHSGCNSARTSGFSRSALTMERTGNSMRFGGFWPPSF